MRLRPGFTFLEVMIVVSLLGVVFLAVGNYVSRSLETWRIVREQANLQNEVRKSMQFIEKYIREMTSSDNGSFAIESAQDTSFIFYSNIDDDDDRERVRIFWENEELKLGSINPTGNPATYASGDETVQTVADSITLSGDLFSYFDENYTGIEDPLTAPINATDIHLIQIHFFVDNDPNRAPLPIEMAFQVTPRNLKVYTSD